MTTAVDICNRALQAMGTRSTISGLNDGSPEANACNLRYASLRDDLLRGAPWAFAKRTATLALLKAAPGTPENPDADVTVWNSSLPAPPWLYAYAYPPDCIRFRQIAPATNTFGIAGVPLTPVTQYAGSGWGGAAAGRWETAADTDLQGSPCRVINTDQDQAIGVYTAQVTTEDLWDPSFIRADEFALAAELTIALSGDKKLREMYVEYARGIIVAARTNDANEGARRQEHTPDWIRARGLRGFWGQSWDGPCWDPVVIGGYVI